MGVGHPARVLGTVVLCVGLLGVQLAASMAAGADTRARHGHGPSSAYTCTGGTIPAGTYRSITVTGVCSTPAGDVTISRDLLVAPSALLDSVSPGDPTTGAPVVPATLHVGGDVVVGRGAVLLLGCSPQIACANPPSVTFDTIGGDLTAIGAQAVVLHSVEVRGDVTILGGGGGPAADTCAAQLPGAPTNTALAPWSLDPGLYYTPVYSDVEDASIGGSLTVAGLDSCWLGTLRDEVGHDAWIARNHMGDHDAMEVGSNLVGGSLGCWSNSPAVQFGDGGAAPSIVGHRATGQCSFSTTVVNPSAAAGGPGIAEHVSVPARALASHGATYTETLRASLPAVTTSAGDTLGAGIYDFTLTSAGGLRGAGTYDPTQSPGATGATILTSSSPGGWTSFMGYLNCACSLSSQAGPVAIRIYGTVSPSGQTDGTFLVTSGGGLSSGSLDTLAGYGTFSSSGQPAGTLRVTEHVAVT